jgi:hypothetical protein
MAGRMQVIGPRGRVQHLENRLWQGRSAMRFNPYSGPATRYYQDVLALSKDLRGGPLDAATDVRQHRRSGELGQSVIGAGWAPVIPHWDSGGI